MAAALLLSVLFMLLAKQGASSASSVGVNYGRMGDNLPSPPQAAKLLAAHGIGKVKLYDADPAVIQAFANTGIEVAVSMYNEVIWALASSQSEATKWLNANIVPHIPATNITSILVGNEVLTRADPGLTPVLVPAMKNLQSSLVQLGLSSKIKLTTPHAMDVLDMVSSFPPSSGTFRNGSINSTVMKPLLEFLAETGAPFMVDAYPYFAYRDDKGEHVELAYALLDKLATGVKDWRTGLHYSNMLDAQVDTIYAAMSKLGHDDVRVVVAETGWPSAGDARNYGAGMANGNAFVGNLVAKILEDPPKGTPLKPGVPVEAYLFALFNENLKEGSTAERNFGLFYPNTTQVYHLNFTR